MLTGSDESVHPRPADAPPTWQENCFVLGHDQEGDTSVYVHVERMHDRVEVKAAVGYDDEVVWFEAHDDWWPDVETPFESLRLRWAGGPLAFDLRLSSHLPPADHAAALERLGLPGAERDHYEAVGRFEGAVSVHGSRRTTNGLFVRDHTWGNREYHQFGASWWFPTCFDGGDAYVGGVAVDLGGRSVGYGIVADDAGLAVGTDVAISVSGSSEPFGYEATSISFTPEGREPVVTTSTTNRHLCTTFPAFGADRRWNEAYSVCRWEGRVGFGTRELGC